MLRKALLVLVTLAVIIGGLYAGGYLLPAEAHVDTFVSIDAEPEHVRPLVESFEAQKSWMLRGAEALGMTGVVISHAGGPPTGVGLQVAWDHEGRRLGTATLRETTDSSVVYDVDFAGTRIERTLSFEQVGPLTRLSWAEDAVLADPLQRYAAVLMHRRLQEQISAHLGAIKEQAEPLAVRARAAAEAAREAEKLAAERAAKEAAAAQQAAEEAAMDEWEYEGKDPEAEKKPALLVPVGPK